MRAATLAACVAIGLSACGSAPQDAASKSATPGRPAQAASTGAPALPAASTTAAATAPGAEELAKGKRAYGETNPARALELFLEAAKKGNAEAQYYAGLMLADGQGVSKRDPDAAAKLYQQAAAQGQPDAMYQLARLHTLGVGVDINVPRAIELFDQAAQRFPPGPDRSRAIEQRDALRALTSGQPVPATPDQQRTTAAARRSD